MRSFMRNSISWIFFILVITFLVISCNKKEDEPPAPPSNPGYSNGVFVINEGPFGTGTGTITYLNRSGSENENRIYQTANNLVPLGNVVQSATIVSDKVYIAVNNANKIEITSLKSFQSFGSIENMPFPRYIVFNDIDKVYISCWDNTVKVINTEGLEVFGQINVGTGPEKMLLTDQHLFVLNQGGYEIDSTISVIDLSTDQNIHTIQAYPRPTGVQTDMNGNIWVVCSGRGSWHQGGESEGHLLKIDPNNFDIISDFQFPSISDHPDKLVINMNKDILFYFYNGGIYKFSIDSNELETVPFITHTGFFYGLGLDPETDVIYASDAVDFMQDGWVYRYKAEDGSIIDSLKAGIAPGEFCFTRL